MVSPVADGVGSQPGHRWPSGDVLEAADQAARAQPVVGVARDVADLARKSVDATQHVAVEDDAGRDAGAQAEVRQAGWQSVCPRGEIEPGGRRAGVVFDEGGQTDLALEQRSERQLFAAQVDCHADAAGARVDVAGEGHTDGADRAPELVGEVGHGAPDQLSKLGREAAAVSWHDLVQKHLVVAVGDHECRLGAANVDADGQQRGVNRLRRDVRRAPGEGAGPGRRSSNQPEPECVGYQHRRGADHDVVLACSAELDAGVAGDRAAAC